MRLVRLMAAAGGSSQSHIGGCEVGQSSGHELDDVIQLVRRRGLAGGGGRGCMGRTMQRIHAGGQRQCGIRGVSGENRSEG